MILFCQEILKKVHFFHKTRFFPKRKNWQLGKYLIYRQLIELYRMHNSNLLYIHFYFFRFFTSNGTIRAQFTHISVPTIESWEDKIEKILWHGARVARSSDFVWKFRFFKLFPMAFRLSDFIRFLKIFPNRSFFYNFLLTQAGLLQKITSNEKFVRKKRFW